MIDLAADDAPWQPRYRRAFLDVFAHAVSALAVTLALLALDRLLGALHGRQTAFHDAVSLLLHYAQALPAILSFVGVSLLLLLATVLMDRWPIARSLRERLVLPALQTAEHMVTLGLGIFGAWAVVDPAGSGFDALTGARGLAAITLALVLLLATACFCAGAGQFMRVDYPRLVARHGRKRYPAALVSLLVLFAVLYWELVWRYPGLALAH